MDFYDDIEIYGDLTAIITEDSGHVSYRKLLNAADALKEKLDGRCLVFSVCENSLEAIIGYIGFLRTKAVPVMISNTINQELLIELLKKYKPKYLWLPQYKATAIENCTLVFSYMNYVLLKTTYYTDYLLHDDLALLLTTSGSTGSPNLVRLSYRNITSNANAIADYLNITQNDRPITTLPMAYTYGLSIINSHFLKGCAIIVTNQTLMNKIFWQLIKANNATTFGGVPYTYEMLKKLRFGRMNLPSLKVLTQAGGRLGKELSREFAVVCHRNNIRFIVMYGQTEATARISYLPDEYAETKAGSIGVAIPGGQLWLEDDNGGIIEDIEVTGELVYKGDNVAMGYAESYEDLKLGDTNGGILYTGDMAKRDSDGFYYIVGRKKRFLKIFGNRVNLDEAESILKVAGIDAICAGKDDNLIIYTTVEKNVNLIKDVILKKTDIHMKGFSVVCIDVIPRNDTGKVLYSAL